MRLDSSSSCGADSLQGPDVNAEKWKIHQELKLEDTRLQSLPRIRNRSDQYHAGRRVRGASNAICTANGGHFARAKRRTKTLPDPWSMGALRGAILGDVAATPKMAGLAYEDGTGSVSLSVLCRKLLWHEEIVDQTQRKAVIRLLRLTRA